MMIYICGECGNQVNMGQKPKKCQCGAENSYVEVEAPHSCGCGCGGPRF